jgi:hypothetical protein
VAWLAFLITGRPEEEEEEEEGEEEEEEEGEGADPASHHPKR